MNKTSLKSSVAAVLSLVAIASGISIAGCGGGSSTPPPPITIALTPNSAQVLDASQSASFSATVSNDSGNQGVSWTVKCSAGLSACGAMAQTKSTSGQANQFVAPATVSAAETVTVNVTSVSDPTKSASVQVTVNPALALASPPPSQPKPGLVGGPFSFNLMNFVQGGTAPFTWTINSGKLPAGLTLDSKTGTVAGTPTAATTAAVIIVFNCTDSGNPATTLSPDPQISFTINKPSALTITSSAPPAGTMNVNYGPSSTGTLRCVWQHSGLGVVIFQLVCTPCSSPSACALLPMCTGNIHLSPCRKSGQIFGFTLTATGGVPGYTWALASGSSLPPGLNLAVSGIIAGKPTQFGTFSVTVSVSDSASTPTQTSTTYNIKIAPPPPPVISVVPPLPIGTLNSPYVGFTFTASGGVPPLTWSATGLPSGMSLSGAGALSGTPTSAGSFPISVQVQDSASQNSAPQTPTIQILAKGFLPTGSMETERVWHTATLLGNGKVLVTGGVNTTAFPTTAELYDSATAKFSQTTGSLTAVQFSATATLLKNGKVLLIGGKAADGSELATAELFDPAIETFAATTGVMSTGRSYHTATLLGDGTVLVTGGLDPAGDAQGTPVASAEIYDPATGSFTLLAAAMNTGRSFHTATLLGDGKVLIAGGSNAGTSLATAELYDPAAKTFALVGNMTAVRAGHSATMLNGGKVLMTGGGDGFGGNSTTAAELYDPSTASFVPVNSMKNPRSLHTTTLLNNGQVLVAGGGSVFYGGGQSYSLSSAELFDPATGSFSATADMTAIRESHTATLLGNGQVLVVGGANGTLGYSPTTVFATAEVYQ